MKDECNKLREECRSIADDLNLMELMLSKEKISTIDAIDKFDISTRAKMLMMINLTGIRETLSKFLESKKDDKEEKDIEIKEVKVKGDTAKKLKRILEELTE